MVEVFKPNAANFVALTPLSFLSRTAGVYPDRVAVRYENKSYTWSQLKNRSQRLAGAIRAAGVKPGQVVSVIAANTPEMVEAHYGVPLSGAILNSINVRLEPESLAYIFDHAETKILITDTHFSAAVKEALALCKNKDFTVIDIVDTQTPAPANAGEELGTQTYEQFIADADPLDFVLPKDEWATLALNYTSGTSGRPKGVLCHHRGSYLMAMGTIPAWAGLPLHPEYLYCVPLFHCNGWNHVWTMTIMAGTINCIRDLSAGNVYRILFEQKITHFGAAPIILGNLVNASDEDRRPIDHAIEVFTAGAPPPAAILAACAKMGLNVTQVYGLTETYGHAVGCFPQESWDTLPLDEQAVLKARQGAAFPSTEAIRVVDVATRKDVPADGETEGEILIQGNTVMKGYHKDPDATAEVFADGAFKTGDVAVMHPGGYVEIRDRLKDVIISGGENISSIEVEGLLYKHPAVANAAVVAMPNEKWGEVPCAFVELKEGMDAPSDEDFTAWCRERMAGFKTPKRVVYGELPKTVTGKIQKFELRKAAKKFG